MHSKHSHIKHSHSKRNDKQAVFVRHGCKHSTKPLLLCVTHKEDRQECLVMLMLVLVVCLRWVAVALHQQQQQQLEQEELMKEWQC